MAIIPVTQDDVETFTIVTTPIRHYSSSSYGVTGSVKVFARGSSLEKETTSHRRAYNDSNPDVHTDINFDSSYSKLRNQAATNRDFKLPILGQLESYVQLVDKASIKPNNVLEIGRFTPSPNLTKHTLLKNNIKDILIPYYRTFYPHANWAYTNYHSINFFTDTGGFIPTSSVLLYPNVGDADLPSTSGYASGSYSLTGAFSFDFHINPRYQVDGIDVGHFKAGTIFHLSSSYALSLITGSNKDPRGLPTGYRLQLQLSHSADYPPSSVIPGNYPKDLVFVSDDNSLSWNNWHHVVVRWGTQSINDGTGSFVVDGFNKGDFVIPSGTINPQHAANTLNPDVLCVGNYYEGHNFGGSAQSLFFATNPATRDGVYSLVDDPSESPAHYKFRHPLKAELHDITIRRKFLRDYEVNSSGTRGLGNESLAKDDVAFYLPPFFVEETPIRKFVGDHGGILQTPFFEIDGTTDDPFNVALSFGVAGHYINLENFTKDFSSNRFPRLMELSASTVDYTTDAQEANYFLYQSKGTAKRNLTVLPCDDGTFDPNYELLFSEKLQNHYADSNGNFDISYINLDNLVTINAATAGGLSAHDPDSDTHKEFSQSLIGPTPEIPGSPPGPAVQRHIANVATAISASGGQDYSFDRGIQQGMPLTIFQRLLDPSSNQVTFFNISNLYYGRKILPGSFTIKDSSISGSHGSVSITLKDDGFGNLYRADSFTELATQNSVGNIFYDEGIILVKNPHLYFFGKDQIDISFKGIRPVYSTKYEILAGPGMLNSSSNASYIANKDRLKASLEPGDDGTFVYISGINFHDDNMNVIARAKLAQPIIKREHDKILFKVSFDR